MDSTTLEETIEVEENHHYMGIAQESFSKEAIDILLEEIDPLKVSILRNGPVYLTQNEYRRRLNRAFGPGGWALKAKNVYHDEENNVVVYSGTLYAMGRYVGEAIGDNYYKPGERGASFATSAEAAKSECLTRCCKDLGIASELWDKGYIEKWKKQYAVEVWCENAQGEKSKKFWRLISDGPIEQWPWREKSSNTAYNGSTGVRYEDDSEDRPRSTPASRPPSEVSLTNPELLTLGFGKHKGKTLANVQDGDSSYFSWLCDKWSPKPREDGSYFPSDVELQAALRAMIAMEMTGAPVNHNIADAAEEIGVNDLPF
jgi:hypothetical protein